VEKARAKTEASDNPPRRRNVTMGRLLLLFLIFLPLFEPTKASTPLLVLGAENWSDMAISYHGCERNSEQMYVLDVM
jgi:hypothetical protein